MKTYEQYREIFKNLSKPFAFVDLDYFDENIKNIKKRAGNKKIRIASKSLRCTDLLRRILASDAQFQGLMTYCAEETVYLSHWGFDDLLIGYPVFDAYWLEELGKEIQKGKTITLMVDSPEQVQQIENIGKKLQVIFPICIDIDMSSDFFGGNLHFGVFRSSIQKPEQALKVYEFIQQNEFIRLEGLMGYEAQIAGLGTKNGGLKNKFIQYLKNQSIKEIALRRQKTVELLEKQGVKFRLINGGGSGSLESTIQENWVSEVTVGSAFYCSGLFDNYREFSHLPAVAYAIEIVRQPKPAIYTCLGGGYVASGAVGREKLPKPYLPIGSQLIDNEGVGEVQTPVMYKGNVQLQLGDPIFLRHAKAGEISERFSHFYMVSDDKITGKIPTYRGEGQCFI